MSTDSFRLILQKEFVARCKRNPSYSLRAFARALDIDQSLLSKILREQRKISTANAQRLGSKLGLTTSQIKSIVSHKITGSFAPLSDDEFAVLADWYHFAILELAKTKDFSPTPRWIARRLGIHSEEARTALERLQRLGLAQIKNGRWTARAAGLSSFKSTSTTELRRNLQRGFLERAQQALDTVPFHQRENAALTVAIDRRRIPEFKEKLKKVREELGEFFQAKGDLNEVYVLTMSLYPLSKLEGEQQ